MNRKGRDYSRIKTYKVLIGMEVKRMNNKIIDVHAHILPEIIVKKTRLLSL